MSWYFFYRAFICYFNLEYWPLSALFPRFFDTHSSSLQNPRDPLKNSHRPCNYFLASKQPRLLSLSLPRNCLSGFLPFNYLQSGITTTRFSSRCFNIFQRPLQQPIFATLALVPRVLHPIRYYVISRVCFATLNQQIAFRVTDKEHSQQDARREPPDIPLQNIIREPA
jgi:hypothetical protein